MFYIDNDTTTNDKYDMAKFMEFDNDGVFNSLNSYFLYNIPQLPLAGSFILETYAGRPDMVSHSIYGSTQYWWIIMWYNHLLKPQDLKIGMVINYPTLGSIEQLYMNASLLHKVK